MPCAWSAGCLRHVNMDREEEKRMMSKATHKQIRQQNWKIMKRRWQMYLFLVIPLIWLIIFKYVPMAGVQIAFRNYKIKYGIWDSPWVGLKNFKKFFQSYQFERVLWNTIKISIYSLAANFPLPIILALCLNALLNMKYKKFAQTLLYIPHFISTVVMVGMILQIFNIRVGLYGNIARLITGSTPTDILGSATTFPHLYVWSGVWQGMGWGSIIYIAALSNVDPALHEAAQIDGASRFQRCIHIDFPTILPTATILLIMNMGSVMGVGFEKVYLMQNPLNLRSSEVISTYVYKVSMAAGGGNDFSYGTAIGLFNSVVNLMLLIIVNAISRKVGETSLW